jgi:hypothetical protein
MKDKTDSTGQETGADVRDPAVLEIVRESISRVAGDRAYENADMVQEIIVTALKAVEARLGRGDLKLLSRSMREMRYAIKIFNAYKDRRKVSIFGSARTKPEEPSYELAVRFARLLNANGYMTITGAGPGIMEAGNKGAGPGGSFGVDIRLPFEQFPNRYIADAPTYMRFRYFFTRKLLLVKEASAAAFFPGGFGTLDETFELLTLIQTGKRDPIPLLFLDAPGRDYWKELDSLVRRVLLEGNKISAEDLHLYKITDSAEEAADEIFRFYSNYHSMRFVRDELVMRLQRPVAPSTLGRINDEFRDILAGGEFRSGPALAAEQNDPELAHLPRLIFKFNRVDNGRLRQLIDFINVQ